jgi:hypothetical protein
MFWGSIQEREEMEFEAGRATELQNAYAVSQMERKPDDRAMAEELVSLGRHVVVREAVIYCPRTDASMGTAVHLLGDFETQDEAAALAREDGADDGDCWVRVMSPKPVILNPYTPPTLAEIPF